MTTALGDKPGDRVKGIGWRGLDGFDKTEGVKGVGERMGFSFIQLLQTA